MKIFKQLLWFIIPTVVIWIIYFLIVTVFGGSINSPRFADDSYYFALFAQDDLFLPALANTLKIVFLPALGVSAFVYILSTILKAKSLIKYILIFAIATVAGMFFKYIIFDTNIYITVFDVICSLQCAIICCLLCRIVDFLL